MSRSVYIGGFLNLLGQIAEEVHQENHIEYGNRSGQHQGPHGVQHSQRLDGHIGGNQAPVEHHRHDEEPGIHGPRAEGTFLLGQREGGQNRHHNADDIAQCHPLQ
ncbi:hypothetical protein D3C71_1854870 [compost metagenome]